MKRALALSLLLVSTCAFAAPAPQNAPMAKRKAHVQKPAGPSVADTLMQMKQSIDAQQQQIQQLRQDLQTRDQAIQQLQQRLDQSQAAATDAQTKAEAAAAQAASQDAAVSSLRSDVTDLKQNSTNTALTLQETQKNISSLESPLAIHYKGITITPGGFFAAETAWRKNATGSDVNTPFNSIPFPGSSASHLSEFFGSGRQSRVSMLAQGKLRSATLTGYVEGDFLSAGVTSNNNQSNSYTLRQRQFWGQATTNSGWSFTGGQMWSLVTETKNGVDNRTEVLPMTIDAQYHVGFSWARQFGFRISKNFNNKMWLAFSAENAQTTVGGEGSVANNFLLGAAGTSGGLYNPSSTYSFNQMPDLIGKIVFQPNKISHIEIFGVFSRFRDRLFPCATASVATPCGGLTTPSALEANNSTANGGGIGANLRADLLNKHLDIGFHFLGGFGVGRYGTSTLPDLFVRADGTLEPIRTYQTLATLEYHDKKWDIYSNAGVEYAQRDSNGTVGYGSPTLASTACYTEVLPGTAVSGQFPTSTKGFLPTGASCSVDTRDLIEGTLGFWYRIYNGPKGRLQFGPQFSYLVRNTWHGTGGAPDATEPMVFTSFRYYLP